MGFDDPCRAVEPERPGCACACHAIEGQHNAALPRSTEAALSWAVEKAVVRALFPKSRARRAFLRAVGGTSALGAIAQFFPLGLVKEVFAAAAPEKPSAEV